MWSPRQGRANIRRGLREGERGDTSGQHGQGRGTGRGAQSMWTSRLGSPSCGLWLHLATLVPGCPKRLQSETEVI